MSRLQLALNVSDLDEGIAFYSRLFGTSPAKVRPGYANFEIADPPLKLVLFERDGAVDHDHKLNHLGIEVDSTDEVTAAAARLAGEGLAATAPGEQTCCFAVQDKTYVTDPDGEPWEIYVVKADAPAVSSGGCCS
jgi:catechol-2,3-dioxygenase